MPKISSMRQDLREIKYYFMKKQMFDKAFEQTGETAVLEKFKRINEAMRTAPLQLYDLYYSLYIKNLTQEALAHDLGYATEYVHILNKKLLKYLQEKLEKKDDSTNV